MIVLVFCAISTRFDCWLHCGIDKTTGYQVDYRMFW